MAVSKELQSDTRREACALPAETLSGPTPTDALIPDDAEMADQTFEISIGTHRLGIDDPSSGCR